MLGATLGSALLSVDYGGAVAGTLLGKPLLIPQLLGPSALWDPTASGHGAGSGFDPTGMSAFAAPTVSSPRLITDNPRPSCRPAVRSFETVDRAQYFGFMCAFSGQAGGAQGIQKVRFDLEGARLETSIATDYSFTDINGVLRSMHLPAFLLKYASTLATCVSKGNVKGRLQYYVTVFPNDSANADPLCVGPFYVTLSPNFIAAPWDTSPTPLKIYDQFFQVDKTGVIGGSYLTLQLAMQAAITASSTSPLIGLARDGSHFVANNMQVTSGPTNALEWCTIQADPRTVSTGAWIGDGTATSNFSPRYDGLQLQGFLTKLDVTMVGAGFATFGPGGTSSYPSMSLNGIDMYAGSGAATDTNWNGLSGAAAMYKGIIPQSGPFFTTNTNIYFLEVDVHDTFYGLSYNIGRNCIGNLCFKFHQNVLGSYGCTISNTGTLNSPYATPIPTLSTYYTGAATVVQIAKETTTGGGTPSGTGASGFLNLYEDSASPAWSLAISNTVMPQDIVNWLNGGSSGSGGPPPGSYSATLIATTPATTRSAAYIWTGSRPAQPANQGVPKQTLSHSAGSPLVVNTIVDVHCDSYSSTGSGALIQNGIALRFASYGSQEAQCFFLDRSANWADFYLSGEFTDITSVANPGFTQIASGLGKFLSNVVIEYTTCTGVGSVYNFLSTSTADKWCKWNSMFVDGGFGSFGTTTNVQLTSLANNQTTIPALSGGGTPDANSVALGFGSGNNYAGIFVDATGVSPYGYRGMGTKPNLTPLGPAHLLKTAISGVPIGSRDFAGNLQVAF